MTEIVALGNKGGLRVSDLGLSCHRPGASNRRGLRAGPRCGSLRVARGPAPRSLPSADMALFAGTLT
eukprot:9005844-Pyramimonas_sp.AAC.2